MSSLVLVGGVVVVGLSFLSDPEKTVQYATAAITIRGATFLAEKIAETQNKESSQIINLAGWCLAGVPIIGILGLSLHPLYEIGAGITKVKETCQGISEWISSLAFWK